MCKFVVLRGHRPRYACPPRKYVRKMQSILQTLGFVHFFGTPLPLRGGFPPKKRKSFGLSNHDYLFLQCLRIYYPSQYAFFMLCIIGLFRLIIKKEFFFLKKFVVLSCVFAFFVVLRGHRPRYACPPRKYVRKMQAILQTLASFIRK